ncbi:MAG: DNA helicase, partial [Deltaproteobacteria bacterium]|nr:DNA helicase [Deltaproteobacteria bacterium]
MANPKTKQMSKEQRKLFDLLWEDREENAKVLEKPSMEGTKTSVIDKYSEQAHFIYELLQNADDVKATKATFELNKDGLLFSHNGKIHFSISDPQTEWEDKAVGKLGHVNSITSIGNTTKIESEIGKFGYGFKSVFQYTSTPHVYDPPFTFKIERLVVPILLSGDHPERVGSETMFFLPFNSDNKPPDRAFDEIGGLLKKLDCHPLLFLRYLEKVEWRDNDGNLGIYRKKPDTEKKDNIISLITNVNGESSERRFLVFKGEITDPHRSDIQHTIGVAFNLHLTDNQIISDNKYPAYCFFATREETGLRFIVQAPFLLTDNREGIKQGENWNGELIGELSELVANSLPKLRDIGLFNNDSLQFLPIEYFPEDHLFHPVYGAVLNKFRSEERLIPGKEGGHINANQAILARGKELTDLLDSKQLSLLLGREDAEWVDTNITENTPLWDYLNKKLEIPVLRPEGVANHLHDEFMEEQTDKWIASFYAYLIEYPKLWKSPTSVLRKKEFIRLEDNT